MSKVKAQTLAPVKESSSPTVELTPPAQRKTVARAPLAPQQASSNGNGAPHSTRAADTLIAPARAHGSVSRARQMTSMQRTVGNSRLSRMMSTTIQPKLTVGAPDNIYEREADRVAETLTQPGATPITRTHSAVAQTASSSADKPDTAVDENMEDRIKSPNGGQSLPEGIQREMESGLGADFSQVRVHDSARDQADAGDLNARAFTHGSDIWLGAGESANDRKLMAHELTHVVQQGGVAQRKLAEEPKGSAVTQAESSPQTPEITAQRQESLNTAAASIQRQVPGLPPALIPPAISLGFEAVALVGKGKVYELKGKSKFEPDIFLQAYINVNNNLALVDVRFGSLAKGKMYIERRGTEFFAAPTALTMTHSEISPPGGGQNLSLIVSIGPGNAITGSVGVTKPLPPNSMGASYGSPEDQERFLKLLIGESGEKGKVEDFNLQNELKDGNLNFEYTFVNTFQKGTYLVASIVMINEAFAFKGSLHASGKGLTPADTEVTRDKRGDLVGNVQMGTEWEGMGFTGKLNLTYEDGVIEIQGTLTYESPHGKDKTARLKGQVHVLATQESRARQAIAAQLASAQEGPNPLGGAKPASGGPTTTGGGSAADPGGAPANVEDSLAIVGWGTLKLVVTDKIEADAAFVVEPEGYLTVRGTIRAPHKIQLMDAKSAGKEDFFKKQVNEMFRVVWAAGIRVRVGVSLSGEATIGPLTLHDITVTGLYSTRPGAANELQISAKLNLSGSASLTLKATGEVAARIGFKYDWTGKNVASVTLDTSAKAEVRGVVEATPTIKMQTGGAAGDVPKYMIGGELFIGGEVDLTLTGDLIFDAPLLHKEIHLGDKVYPIAGFGLTTNMSYTLGSDEPPVVTYKKGNFEPYRFMREVVREKAPKEENKAEGGFKEDGKEKGHVIPSDDVPDAPPQEPRTQVVQFTMNGAPHSLFLTLGGPHDPVLLEMASKRGPLKPKIVKAEKDLLESKDDFFTDEPAEKKIERRVADLEQAEADATHVEQAASNLGAETGAGQMDAPGFHELGRKFEVYGDRYNVKDLAEPTPGQSPLTPQPSAGTGTDTDAEEVLSSWPGLKKDQQIIDKVRGILDTGQLPQAQFRTIMDKAKINGAPGARLLNNLEELTSRGIAGLRVVLSDLEIGGNKFLGAEFMLTFIGEEGLWEHVRKFESAVDDRRIDAIIKGTDYEFKSWGEFRAGTFLEQIKKDYTRKEGLRAVRWVFKKRELGTKAEIIQMMTDALNDRKLASSYGINRTQAAAIIDELERVVIVY